MTYNYSYIYKNFSNFPRNEIKFSIIRVTSPSNIFTGGEISRYIWNSTQFVSKYASWCASFFLGAAKSRQHPPFNRWIFAKTSYAADLEFFFFSTLGSPVRLSTIVNIEYPLRNIARGIEYSRCGDRYASIGPGSRPASGENCFAGSARHLR